MRNSPGGDSAWVGGEAVAGETAIAGEMAAPGGDAPKAGEPARTAAATLHIIQSSNIETYSKGVVGT